MTAKDANQLAEAVVERLLARGIVAERKPVAGFGAARGRDRAPRWHDLPVVPHWHALPVVPRRLTVPEFGVCVGLCAEVVRRKIRERFIPREQVEGPPYRIDREALVKFRVPVELAAERLRAAPTPPATPAPSLRRFPA